MNCIYSDDCPVHRLGIQACERRFRDDCRGCAKIGGDEPEGMSEELSGEWEGCNGPCDES